MVTQFDTVIHPRESAAFSVPPDRDGSNAHIGPDANGNGGDYTGAGRQGVVLVDNIRHELLLLPGRADQHPRLLLRQFNELFDRNVVSLDAFDWLHRTTATPPTPPPRIPAPADPRPP